ncbi:hypothetical protein PTI45_03799 [Paenibacillus nuruki]|uniref:Uncharacterized protein n=2 Tax=Paenibacillus nuruki TaxID=1886670 RepID=A0A1E3KZ77_9BACL|nr:hypothetical protein [Paenibacillus sp. CFBP13512]ODP26838.1 hypothetical protein PTI45_03799 [Paenibacillus nuruki]TKJ87227.1 hypothetical protein PaeCFBP13512_18570 [Paenibacillus sp. CFBP13512]
MDEKKQQLIKNLQQAANHFKSNTLTRSQYLRYQSNYATDAPTLMSIYNNLGKWKDALELAGLSQQEMRQIRCGRCGKRFDPQNDQNYCIDCVNDPKFSKGSRRASKKYTEEEIISVLHEAASLIEGSITIPAYEELKLHPCTTTIRNHFGSWSNALKKAGLYKRCLSYKEK